MTRPIQVTDQVHERLMVLKGVLGKKNVSEVIIQIMKLGYYNDGFFERLKGLI